MRGAGAAPGRDVSAAYPAKGFGGVVEEEDAHELPSRSVGSIAALRLRYICPAAYVPLARVAARIS
jgi:hypothetical protein